jgi:hypothetical protein
MHRLPEGGAIQSTAHPPTKTSLPTLKRLRNPDQKRRMRNHNRSSHDFYSTPFERDPEPEPTASEKPNGEDAQPYATGIPKTTPALPTVRKKESVPCLDTRFEASKLPLDLAIFHSIQASTVGAGSW